MQIIGNTHIDFISKRKIAFIISGLVILAGLISIFVQSGLNYGIDFAGGVLLEIDLTPANDQAETLNSKLLRKTINDAGYEGLELQAVGDGNIFVIKAKGTEQAGDKIVNAIKKAYPNNIGENFIRRQEEVGPRIGDELKGKAVMAIFYALLGIIIYIWWRFELTFGFAAVIALFHDILITVGIISILGPLLHIEFDLKIVAALLTIVGYSLNDTIVIFDRIREDLRKYRRKSPAEIINASINESLSRTVVTSITTFIAVLALYIFGGTVINGFAFALLIGVIVGTYSSIFVASPIIVEHFNRKKK